MENMDKNLQGIQYMQEGKWEEAVKVFNEIIEESPEDPIAYINFGNLLATLDDNERALQFFQKAIELDEDAASAYYSMGICFMKVNSISKPKICLKPL